MFEGGNFNGNIHMSTYTNTIPQYNVECFVTGWVKLFIVYSSTSEISPHHTTFAMNNIIHCASNSAMS